MRIIDTRAVYLEHKIALSASIGVNLMLLKNTTEPDEFEYNGCVYEVSLTSDVVADCLEYDNDVDITDCLEYDNDVDITTKGLQNGRILCKNTEYCYREL